MEPEGSLPYSHVPATCPYPEFCYGITYKNDRTLFAEMDA
jgi:hypothetical protein